MISCSQTHIRTLTRPTSTRTREKLHFNNNRPCSFLGRGAEELGGSERRLVTEAARTPHRAPRHTRDIHHHIRNRPTFIDAYAKVTAVCAASAHTLVSQRAQKMTFGANHDSSAGVEVKEEEEEETLAQLRDRQVLASARAAMPGTRARFVHIKVEETTSGEDTDGEGGGGDGAEATAGGEGDGEVVDEEEVKEEVEREENDEEQAELRDQRAHVSGASLKGDSEAVRPQSLSTGAHSEPGFPRARLQAPGRVADNTVQVNDDIVQQHTEKVSFAPVLRKREGGAPPGSSRFKGVSWYKASGKWQAKRNGTHLGIHTTEGAAACAYGKHLEDGSVPRPAVSSHFKGVSWDITKNKWRAICKGTQLGYHATEEDAARARNKYLMDGIDPVTHRGANTSQLTGVSWDKQKGKWKARCKGKALGIHTTEKAAAQAYNIEAECVGRPLNVIPPAGAPGTGAGPGTAAGGGADHKRAAPKTPAALATNKKRSALP